ncbi:MAG: hypothetical protein QHC90_25240 [Shinella sp.]|nr:hypothetical protein [Shinella sp.]
MQIDHDPDEPKIDRGPGPWKIAIPVLVVIAAINFVTRDIDWISLCLGLAIGGGIVAWAVDITGNKVPDSWRSKPPGSRRS